MRPIYNLLLESIKFETPGGYLLTPVDSSFESSSFVLKAP